MSSEGTQRILPGKTRRAEEQHLKETVGIIRKNVERYSEEVALLRTDIDDMQAHFHDDNPELINTLENTYTMYDFQNRTLERNLRALKKPYFGRIDFHDETLDIDEAFYIGKCGISKDATHPLVIDWRTIHHIEGHLCFTEGQTGAIITLIFPPHAIFHRTERITYGNHPASPAG